MKRIALILVILLSFSACKSAKESQPELVDLKAEPVLIRQPYLQMVRPNTVTITWKTNAVTGHCKVVYNDLNSLEENEVAGKLVLHEGDKFNEVVIKNLKPQTAYNYAIYSNGYLLASGKDYFFTTAPDNKNTAFSFYALGDIGAKEKQSFAIEPATRITELGIKPDFGLGLGDIVYPKGESKNYDNHLFKPFEKVFKNTPFYPVAGNHDWLSDPEKNFEKEWALPDNEHYYGFSYANAYFIGLDSRNGGFFELEKQTKWLNKELKKVQGKYDWIIVFLHHNGKTCTYKENYHHVENLYPIFANSNVDLVLNGHAHTYERLKPYDASGNVDRSVTNQSEYKNLENRFISITLGAGGKLNKKWFPDPFNLEHCKDGTIVAHAEHVGSFGLFEINGKSLVFKAYNSFTGTVFDSFTIKK
ncbi:purple acid phosphatase family protein [Tamlana sp. I1]|uniref:purple acid phosphatase family protein n=1 Tax=Tamlana sp. I1 TaxID=2762061 RepID=UPI001890912D|nr:metallophosphoesterase family protein [Tamlana sp. I1]